MARRRLEVEMVRRRKERWKRTRYAPRPMHHAPCTMHHAPCPMHHAPQMVLSRTSAPPDHFRSGWLACSCSQWTVDVVVVVVVVAVVIVVPVVIVVAE